MTQAELKILYEEHYEKMLRYALSMVKDLDTAQGIVVEVFIRAYKKLDSSRNRNEVWLIKCTRNLILDHFRNNKTTCEYVDLVHGSSEGLSNNLEPDKLSWFEFELERLPKQTKKVVKLYLDGFTSAEIAYKLHISAQGVRNLKTFAISRLKEKAHNFY